MECINEILQDKGLLTFLIPMVLAILIGAIIVIVKK